MPHSEPSSQSPHIDLHAALESAKSVVELSVVPATGSDNSQIQAFAKSFRGMSEELMQDLASSRDNPATAMKMAKIIREWMLACKNDPNLPAELNPLEQEHTKKLFNDFLKKSGKINNNPAQYVPLYFLYLLSFVALMAELVGIGIRIGVSVTVAQSDVWDRVNYSKVRTTPDKYLNPMGHTDRLVMTERSAERQMMWAGIASVVMVMLTTFYKQKVVNPEINRNLAELTKLFTNMCKAITSDPEAPQLDPKFMERFKKMADDIRKLAPTLVKTENSHHDLEGLFAREPSNFEEKIPPTRRPSQ